MQSKKVSNFKISLSVRRKFPVGCCIRFGIYSLSKTEIGLVIGYLDSDVLQVWDNKIREVPSRNAIAISKPYVKNNDEHCLSPRNM